MNWNIHKRKTERILKALQEGTRNVKYGGNAYEESQKIKQAGETTFGDWIRTPLGIAISSIVGLISAGFIISAIENSAYENNAIVNLENVCRIEWNYYRNKRIMYQKGDLGSQNDPNYYYSLLTAPNQGYNTAIIYASPRQSGRKSLVGIAIVPAGSKQTYYSCDICISNTSKTILYTSTMVSGTTIGCPQNYSFRKRIS
ncbi:MAG: hypothetical protein RLZZ338_3704 [Cyanobacteriota bacterium]|jgi:uncharacterized membrane protein YidH (DUF202 family)